MYSREAMQWQADHAHGDSDINEWIDEQAATVGKWPVPMLSVTRVEWLPHVRFDLYILQTPGKRAAVWNPPEMLSRVSSKSSLVQMIESGADVPFLVRLDGQMDLPLKQLWGNTGAPYALTAGVLNTLLSSVNALHAAAIDLNETMSIAAWTTRSGALRILAGNLEEGLREDADMSRHAALVLPPSWKRARWEHAWGSGSLAVEHGVLPIDLAQAGSVLLQAGL